MKITTLASARQPRLSDGPEPYIPAGRQERVAVKVVAQAEEPPKRKAARLFREVLVLGLLFFGVGCMVFGALEFFFAALDAWAPQ